MGILSAARERADHDDEAVIVAHSFYCKELKRTVSQAECEDCWKRKPFTEKFKYHENREICKEVHDMKKSSTPPAKGKLPAKKNRGPHEDGNRIHGENLVPVGAKVVIELEDGKAHEIAITAEMHADREAALSYAADAAQSKAMAEIQLCVAAALYLGEGEHAPWVIDGFQSVTEAGTTMFGWSQTKLSFRQRLGQTFINQYGKDRVLQRASELGIAQIPHYKLREFLKAPKLFEQFLNTGRFVTPDNKEITIDDICKQGIGQLNLLFEKFTESHALPAGKDSGKGTLDPKKLFPGEDEFDKATKKMLSASDIEKKLFSDFLDIEAKFKLATIAMLEAVKTWPENVRAVMAASPMLQDSIRAAELEAARSLNVLCAIQRDHSRAHEVAEHDYSGGLAGFLTVLNDAEPEKSEVPKRTRSKK